MAFIVRKVYSDTTIAKIKGLVVVKNLATNYGDLANTNVGDTIVFPQFASIGDAEEMTNFNGTTDTLTDEQLSQTSKEERIKQFGKSIFIRDFDKITMEANAIETASSEHSRLMARKEDSELITNCCDKTPLIYNTIANGKALTETELQASLGLFGDERNVEDFAGCIVNSLLLPSLYGMTGFIDATKTMAIMGNGIITHNIVGSYMGIPIFVSDKDTYNTTTSACNTYIIKKGALGYMEKRALMVEEDRQPKKGGSSIVANVVFATHLMADDGVVKITKAGA